MITITNTETNMNYTSQVDSDSGHAWTSDYTLIDDFKTPEMAQALVNYFERQGVYPKGQLQVSGKLVSDEV